MHFHTSSFHLYNRICFVTLFGDSLLRLLDFIMVPVQDGSFHTTRSIYTTKWEYRASLNSDAFIVPSRRFTRYFCTSWYSSTHRFSTLHGVPWRFGSLSSKMGIWLSLVKSKSIYRNQNRVLLYYYTNNTKIIPNKTILYSYFQERV